MSRIDYLDQYERSTGVTERLAKCADCARGEWEAALERCAMCGLFVCALDMPEGGVCAFCRVHCVGCGRKTDMLCPGGCGFRTCECHRGEPCDECADASERRAAA